MARRHEIETRLTAKDKTKAAFNRVQKRMKSLKKASLIAGGGVVAMAAGFAAAGKKAIDFADNIAKTSDRIGMTTKNFQEMAHSFDLAGVSTEQFSGAAAGLQKRIGDLNEDTGSLFTILKDDQAFATLLKGTTDTSEAIRIMVEKLSSTKNAMDRAALASAAFGRSAGSAIAKINLSELDAGIKTAREFGIAIDEDLLRNAEKMKDAFTTAMASFNSQFFSVMLETMNSMNIKQFATDMAAIAKWTVKAALGLGEFFGIIDEQKPTQLQQLVVKIDQVRNSLAHMNRVRAGWRRMSSNDIAIRKKELKDELKILKVRMGLLSTKPKDTSLVVDIQARAKKPWQSFDDGGDQATKLNKLVTKLNAYRAEISVTSDGLKKMNSVQFSSVEAMELYEEKLNTSKDVQNTLNGLRAAGLGISKELESSIIGEAHSVDSLNRALAKKKELLITTDSPIQAYVKNIKSMRHSLEEAAISGADSLTNSLMGIIDGTQKAGEAFKSFARGIIAQLTKMIIKKLIFDRIFGMISAALPGGTTTTSGALPKKAGGGPVTSGRPYMVGERGPELMVPNRSGRIVPNNALGGGGAVINQTINIQTGVSQTVRAEILTLMPQINQATKAAVLDARQRGGSFANGFA